MHRETSSRRRNLPRGRCPYRPGAEPPGRGPRSRGSETTKESCKSLIGLKFSLALEYQCAQEISQACAMVSHDDVSTLAPPTRSPSISSAASNPAALPALTLPP